MRPWSFIKGDRPFSADRFKRGVAAAIREITNQHVDCFVSRSVRVPFMEELTTRCREIPIFDEFSHRELALAMVRGMQTLDDLGLPVSLQDRGTTDSISMLLLRSIFDSYLAARGALDLRGICVPMGANARLFPSYSVRRTRSGASYLIGADSRCRPLLIISATGLPLAAWIPLLNDYSATRQCVIVESRGASFDGGVQGKTSLYDDLADIEEVISSAGLHEVDVLAWRNGCRSALALADEMRDRIHSLILLSPTFRGSADPMGICGQSSGSFWSVYERLGADPGAAQHLLDSLLQPQSVALADWTDIDRQSDSILRLPPHCYRSMLSAPIATLNSFENYVDRIVSDESFPLVKVIPKVRCPIATIFGTHDQVDSVAAARDLLTAYGTNARQVTVFGGGHCIHLSQNIHFRLVLDALLLGSMPPDTMRVSVQRLSGQVK